MNCSLRLVQNGVEKGGELKKRVKYRKAHVPPGRVNKMKRKPWREHPRRKPCRIRSKRT